MGVLTFDVEAEDKEGVAPGICTFRVSKEDVLRIIPEGFTKISGRERQSKEDLRELIIQRSRISEISISNPNRAVLLMALAIEQGEELDLSWKSDGSAFWLLHDIAHVDDCRIDLEAGVGGMGDLWLPEIEGGATFRAGIEAHRTGLVSVEEAIREMEINAVTFERRFKQVPTYLKKFQEYLGS